MPRKPIIGLTGPTGAGKGVVSKLLEQKCCVIIDCDAISREIYLPGSPVLSRLCESFGQDILNADGSLNRSELAHRAFANEEKTKLLNSITHSEILKVSFGRALKAISDGKAAVIDAAALFESGSHKACDFNVAVLAPLEIRLERIMKRDGISKESALERIGAQKEDEFYLSHADFIIYNDGLKELDEQLRDIFEKIESNI